MIIGIVAVDNKWGIGRTNKETGKGELLFNLPLDMQHFRSYTSNKIVACGLNTLLSFPGSKPLKGRSTLVLCPEGYERNDCVCIHSFEEMLKLIKELSKTQDVYIIGGAMFYQSMLPHYDKVIVTKVDADGQAEVFFPNLDENPDFEYTGADVTMRDGDYKIRFWTYERCKR